jgi:hypothetical protein
MGPRGKLNFAAPLPINSSVRGISPVRTGLPCANHNFNQDEFLE